MAGIELKNVTKSFGKNTVIDNLNLSIEDGKFTVLIGPSGCGKTTILRMIAGIGPQSSGQVFIDGEDVSNVDPGKRGVAMVFQNYAIYPTMSVRGNIEFGLKNNKVPKLERERRIKEVVEAVGLSDFLDRKPSTLSGGQRQRIALARAMVKQPKVFLMDEPLSNLDAKLRVQMRVELVEIHKRLDTTFVYVTHDQVEAMSMADRIVLLNNGVIQQEAEPAEIYRNPNNIYTAQFIGAPPMNVLDLGCDGVKLGFRPEKVRLSYSPVEGCYNFQGSIVTKEMLGSETIYPLRTSDGNTVMVKSGSNEFTADSHVCASVAKEDLYLFSKDTQRIRAGDDGYDKYLDILGVAER